MAESKQPQQKKSPRSWPHSSKRWGIESGRRGWTVFPTLFLRNLGKLGLTPAQQSVLLILLSFWYDRPPVISKKAVADCAGLDPRQVQRHIASLVKMQLIKTVYPPLPGRHPHEFHFTALVDRVQQIAREQPRTTKKQEEWGQKKSDEKFEKLMAENEKLTAKNEKLTADFEEILAKLSNLDAKK